MGISLRFKEDGTFKILQFTDIHYNKEQQDAGLLAAMRNLLQWEQPDLVVVTGDMIFPDSTMEMYREALEPLAEYGKPWALVFGNHDEEYGEPKPELLKMLQQVPGAVIAAGPEDLPGLGNYVAEVSDNQGSTKWMLYFIDSQDYITMGGVRSWGHITRPQVDWYEACEAAGPKEHGSLAFFHIPLPEYNELWYFHPCHGQKHEPVCPPLHNTGMFYSMLRAGHMRGVFVGHDHTNDFYGSLYGIQLCYGRYTHFSPGSMSHFLPGARIIEINEKDTTGFRTWLRLSDGSVDRQEATHKPGGLHQIYPFEVHDKAWVNWPVHMLPVEDK